MLHAIDRVAERARRTLLNRGDDVVNSVTVGIDPRLLAKLEHSLEVVGTASRVGTNPAIVVDSHAATLVVVSPVRNTVWILLAAETDYLVRAIAIGFILRPPTSTQGDSPIRVMNGAVRKTLQHLAVCDEVRTVLRDFDRRLIGHCSSKARRSSDSTSAVRD